MTNQQLQTSEEPVHINTPYAEEAEKLRNHPTSQAADIASEYRTKIDSWRRHRETLLAFQTTGIKQYEQEWTVREAARAKALDMCQNQIAELQRASHDDRDSLSKKIAQVSLKCDDEVQALETLIKVHETLITGLASTALMKV